ncbi:TRAP transporter, 4TM/12TM fusion protein [Salipiger thiooxidans]|uniref:TRAP transporter, 4TM/12TM fusion protein n=1 Tax=Salipiger thiooxidans TaxID=282683 RepID=A0A1G7LHJ2_9RHOB|nr:TRAP transporter fused permease subunit [Salipiger thiooxidans]SDF48846.1 TRAP transporter, 4TM/12TM fusion protein [Salipiger thiooxidans]
MSLTLKRWIILLFSLAGLLLTVNQTFLFTRAIGVVMNGQTFLYVLTLVFFPLIFLIVPFRHATTAVPGWIDWLLFALSLGGSAYLVIHAQDIVFSSWQFIAPLDAQLVAAMLWLLILEAARRTNGWPLTLVVLFVSLYPMFADVMPGPLNSMSLPPAEVAAYHLYSFESVFGIPMRAFADLVVGFIVFGLALQFTGAAKFFNDVAFALMGTVRGGAAHVAVVSSALQASISGSVISNVMTSGSVSIPAMKKTGFSASYAGGIEAVASTGGVLTPPVMGTTAFIMATFLAVPYVEVAMAAAIPAALFYFGLMLQVDAYAARRGLRGVPRSELPTLLAALKGGWHYLIVFVMLITMLAQGMNESRAAFYATGLLLVVNQLRPENRLSLAGIRDMIAGIGQGLSEIIAVILAIGMIAGGLAATGILSTLSTELVFLAGDAPIMLLIMGALTSFVLGMGMTVSACYIFLAIVMVPALVKVGFEPIAVHLFVMYWGMLSFITPPVAIATYAAAAIAKVSAIKIGFHAMRLASVMYFVPFFFVLNPALVLQGTPLQILIAVATAVCGVAAISWSLQGYMLGFGGISDRVWGFLLRGALLIAGLSLASPGIAVLGITQLECAGFGIALMILSGLAIRFVPIFQLSQMKPTGA